MSSRVTPTRASMPGSLSGRDPHTAGASSSGGINPAAMSLPTVDPEQLKARLYSYAPKQAPINTNALYFHRPTKAQLRQAAVPSAPRLEPLVNIRLLIYVGTFVNESEYVENLLLL